MTGNTNSQDRQSGSGVSDSAYWATIALHFGAIFYYGRGHLGEPQPLFQPHPDSPTIWCDECEMSHTVDKRYVDAST